MTLRDLLKHRGMSISELARQAGVPRPGLSDVLAGKTPGNYLTFWPKVAGALDLSLADLESYLRPGKASVRGGGGSKANLRFARTHADMPARIPVPRRRSLPELMPLPLKFSLTKMGPPDWVMDLKRHAHHLGIELPAVPSQEDYEDAARQAFEVALDEDVAMKGDADPSDYEVWWWLADVPADCKLYPESNVEGPERDALMKRRTDWLATVEVLPTW